MVIPAPNNGARKSGALMVELLVAMAILAGILLPLGWSIISERRLARALYQRAVAMEILDGEMETLVAGEWRSFRTGRQEYSVRAASTANLPRGAFTLTIDPGRLRLEWVPAVPDHGGRVFREARIP